MIGTLRRLYHLSHPYGGVVAIQLSLTHLYYHQMVAIQLSLTHPMLTSSDKSGLTRTEYLSSARDVSIWILLVFLGLLLCVNRLALNGSITISEDIDSVHAPRRKASDIQQPHFERVILLRIRFIYFYFY
jgi:hypothetical protein